MSCKPPADALKEADRCVKCGLCLPHCPTYRLYADENESPRGRLALAEGLLRGHLVGDRKLADHLYRCLMCRRCETACPSGVKYVQVLDAARAKLPRVHWTSRLAGPGALANLLSSTAKAIPLPGSTLSALGRALPGQAPSPTPGIYRSHGKARGRIGLFLGCVTRTHQGNALNAALNLLNHIGFDVEIPPDQDCCGALAQHQGDCETANRQIAANRKAFNSVDQLVSVASGCSLQLREALEDRTPLDILSLLHDEATLTDLEFEPLNERIALHQPCTSINGLRNGNQVVALLQRIPELQLTQLGIAGGCCGAGGNHLITEREQALRLRQPLLDKLLAMQPRYLVSSNIGCALHLAEGARSKGLELETLHPVELLYRQVASATGEAKRYGS